MKDFLRTMEKDYRRENFTVKEWIIAQAMVIGFFVLLFAAECMARWLEGTL